MKTCFAIGGCLLALFLAGCTSMPLRPGRSEIVNPNGLSVSVRQSQNPKQETVQKYERTQDGTKVTEKVETKIGAAQKDVAREIGAKLAGLRPVMYVGILLTLFGIASFHPALRAIVGSVTTSVIIIVAGIGMIVLPRSEEHTSELQSQSNLVCRLLLEKKKNVVSVFAA